MSRPEPVATEPRETLLLTRETPIVAREAPSFSKPDLDAACELETVNGPVQVTLPAANADFVACTLNGEIHVAFPFNGSTDRRSTHGSIGHGGRELRLRTINGTIDVSRGS